MNDLRKKCNAKAKEVKKKFQLTPLELIYTLSTDEVDEILRITDLYSIYRLDEVLKSKDVESSTKSLLFYDYVLNKDKLDSEGADSEETDINEDDYLIAMNLKYSQELQLQKEEELLNKETEEKTECAAEHYIHHLDEPYHEKYDDRDSSGQFEDDSVLLGLEDFIEGW